MRKHVSAEGIALYDATAERLNALRCQQEGRKLAEVGKASQSVDRQAGQCG